MSGGTPTLLSPLSDREFDQRLNRVAVLVTSAARDLTTISEWALNVLIPDNLAADLLLVYDPHDPAAVDGHRPMTAAEMDNYRFFFSQVGDIAGRWTGGSPPATGLVLPWLPASGVSGPPLTGV